jgi:hypothetical protein
MTTTKITLLVPTGTRRIRWKNGQWTIKPIWYRRIQMDKPKMPRQGVRLVWTDTGTTLTRFWLRMSTGDRLICSTTTWSLCPVYYLGETLKEQGINLRYGDTVDDYGSKNGLRDVYITSKSLEKLYESAG